MNSDEFGNILSYQIQRTVDILGSKADEYADDTERLHNFKVIAALQGVTLRQAVVNLMAKHTVSIFDSARSSEEFTKEYWDEKITDHINYLILLQAALAEERKSDEGDAIEIARFDGSTRTFPSSG